MQRILIVLTSHGTLGNTGRKTGFHWEELATPYWIFRDAGLAVEIASIAGGRAPHDPESLSEEAGKSPPSVERFLADKDAMLALEGAVPITMAEHERHDGVFLPGGHGTMWDFPTNTTLATLIGTMFDAGKPVAAVCHGPAGLVSALGADGLPIVRNRRVNGFTNAEEAAVGLAGAMPFLLETRLGELGGDFEGGPDFQPKTVRDGNLVTGQNPASAEGVAHGVLAVLRERGSIPALSRRAPPPAAGLAP